MDTALALLTQGEEITPGDHLSVVADGNETGGASFIEANTIPVAQKEVQEKHIIPVFSKDNETLISHIDFIELVQEVAMARFKSERLLDPTIRVSHPVKGRIPEARNRPVNELQEWEKTLYYERMAFMIEIPTINDQIEGQNVCLTVGGVKSYSEDRLGGKKGSSEHFKFFIGFRVKCCLNLCVWTDGLVSSLGVRSIDELKESVESVFQEYDAIRDLNVMAKLQDYSLTETQFATLLGKAKMYHHLSARERESLPEMLFGDNHINSICKDYHTDSNFSRLENGSLSLWRLYNLFTAANKSSYIDSFLSRSANASSFVDQLAYSLETHSFNWYIG
ncbi:MAG: DUF3871 family protein [Proteobacteria bacterium]|nr:MAG: DUF3871 family protein [Pseudomonadota bacterium]